MGMANLITTTRTRPQREQQQEQRWWPVAIGDPFPGLKIAAAFLSV